MELTSFNSIDSDLKFKTFRVLVHLLSDGSGQFYQAIVVTCCQITAPLIVERVIQIPVGPCPRILII